MQAITYGAWLPILLGEDIMKKVRVSVCVCERERERERLWLELGNLYLFSTQC